MEICPCKIDSARAFWFIGEAWLGNTGHKNMHKTAVYCISHNSQNISKIK